MKKPLFYRGLRLVAAASTLIAVFAWMLLVAIDDESPDYLVNVENPAFRALKRYVVAHVPIEATNHFDGYIIVVTDDPQKIVRLSKRPHDRGFEKNMKARAFSPDGRHVLAELDFNRGMVMMEQGIHYPSR